MLPGPTSTVGRRHPADVQQVNADHAAGVMWANDTLHVSVGLGIFMGVISSLRLAVQTYGPHRPHARLQLDLQRGTLTSEHRVSKVRSAAKQPLPLASSRGTTPK